MSSLPYGVRKRVEVARAICAEPDLLLLDEPVAGMNVDESAEMARSIVQSREALGISIVLVEHDMPFVMGLADRVTVLDFGRVIADGTPARHPARPGGAARLSGVRRGITGDAAMTQFLQLVISGLMLGCIYGLIAMGFVIVFKATNVVNFAHASVVMFGAYLVAKWHGSLGFFGAIGAAAVVERAGRRRTRHRLPAPAAKARARRRRTGDHDDRVEHPAGDRARAGRRERPAAVRRTVGCQHDPRVRRRHPAGAHRSGRRRAGADRHLLRRLHAHELGRGDARGRIGPEAAALMGIRLGRGGRRIVGRGGRAGGDRRRVLRELPGRRREQRDGPAGPQRDPGGGARRPGLDRSAPSSAGS